MAHRPTYLLNFQKQSFFLIKEGAQETALE